MNTSGNYDEKSQEVGRLLFLLDLLLTLLALLWTYSVQELFQQKLKAELFTFAALIPLIWVPLGYSLSRFGAYQGLRVSSIWEHAWSIARALLISTVLLLSLLYLLKVEFVGRWFVITFVIMTFVLLVSVRAGLIWWYFRRSIQKGENFLKVLIIGTGRRAQRLSDVLRKRSEWGIHVVGHLDPEPERVGSSVAGSPVIGTIDQISGILTDQVIDEVVLAIPRNMIGDVEQIADACEEQGVRFRLMADVFDFQVARMRLAELDGIPLLTFDPVAQNENMLLAKRLMDLTITLLCMPLILVIMLLIAVAIKLDSPGPVFFVQPRVGFRKRVFPMLKFRSMEVGSEMKQKELESKNEADGPIFKIKDDPRITRVGKFLRKTSLDELPQLFNVIRGQMSLVGPRPMSLRDVNYFDKGIQRKRFSVKPGLTCLWQISGRSNLPFEKWLELDLEYIEKWSLALDIKILFKTFGAVARGSGAV